MKNKTTQRTPVRKGNSSIAQSSSIVPSDSANFSDSREDEIFAEPTPSSVQNKAQPVRSARPTLAAQALLVPRGSRHEFNLRI